MQVTVLLASVQLQPVPAGLTVAVRPAGSVSVTVTGAVVSPVPMLETVMLYAAPVWP